MDLSSVNNNSNVYSSSSAASEKTAESANKTAEKAASDTAAVVYEKSTEKKTDSANQIYNKDAVVKRLKIDQQNRIDSMQGLVEKLLNRQKGTFDLAKEGGLASTFRKAAFAADPETIRKAKEDISENGYWGVEQTSDRLVSMAIALSGGDTSKADLMLESIQKGYDKATAAWGEDLPKICEDTLNATKEKMNDWKNGVTTAEDYAKYLS